jgi:hypothetical protein
VAVTPRAWCEAARWPDGGLAPFGRLQSIRQSCKAWREVHMAARLPFWLQRQAHRARWHAPASFYRESKHSAADANAAGIGGLPSMKAATAPPITSRRMELQNRASGECKLCADVHSYGLRPARLVIDLDPAKAENVRNVSVPQACPPGSWLATQTAIRTNSKSPAFGEAFEERLYRKLVHAARRGE